MGTRRMWLFLLLAAIQYAGVRATTPLACTSLPVATSDCASYLYPDKPSAHCDQLLTGPSDKPCATADKKWLYKDGNAGEWKQLASIVCDAASRVWKATEIAPPGKTHDLKVADNLICAIPPSPPPPAPECSKCGALVAADCKAADGCVKGGGVVASVDSSTQCKQLKCPPGQFFGTNLPPAAVAEVQINCDSATKWKTAVGNVVVAKAICVQKYECHKKSALASSCAGPKQAELEASGCQPIVLTTSAVYTCSGGKKLFYKKDVAAPWVLSTDNKLKCSEKTTGFWTTSGGTVDLKKDDHAICAKKNPDSIKLCKTAPASTCHATVNANAKDTCSPLALIPLPKDDSPIKCPTATPQPRLYRFDTAANKWNEANIHCELSSGKWMDGAAEATTNVVCAATNPTRRLCSTGAVAIKSECKVVLNDDCESVPLQDNTPLACPSQPMLYFKKAAGGDWEEAKKVACDDETGEWKQGDDPTQLYTMLANDQVLCAGSKPIDKCSESNPLKTECAAGFTGCEPVEFDDNGVPKACTDPKQMHFRHGFEKWTKTAAISCDTAGKWAVAEVVTNLPVKNDIVICFEGDPNANVCTPPTSTCPPTSTTCELLTGDPLACPTPGKKFYFKKDPQHKWMKAEDIGCTGGKLQIKYKFGIEETVNKELPPGGEIICDDTNPDMNVCKYLSSAPNMPYFDKTKFEFEALTHAQNPIAVGERPRCGKPAIADQPAPAKPEEYYFVSSESIETQNDHARPVCGPTGKWVTSAMREEERQDYGEKIGCKRMLCRKCPDTNPGPRQPQYQYGGEQVLRQDIEVKVDQSGECAALKCATNDYFVMKTTADKYQYYTGTGIKCDDDGTWKLGSDKIEKIDCVLMMFCYPVDEFLRLELMECEAGQTAVPGCEKANYNRDRSNQETLECPTGKKMLVKNDKNDWWNEIETIKIDCDWKKGEWAMKILGKANVQSRGHGNTIVCADSNPKPEPTTTTTTTTPAPIFPICEVCNNSRPEGMDGCDKCDGTKIKLTPNSADDECTMNPISKDYKLVINSMEEVAAIVCKRDTQQWTKAGGTGEPITKVSARQETKREAWKTLSYVIVAVVFVAIGGMGIICVVIFMRMRKKLSEREGKKKERGVTKKYNASSVVKTKGNKANTKSETAGKSVEAAKSKTEENLEDAPTLKL